MNSSKPIQSLLSQVLGLGLSSLQRPGYTSLQLFFGYKSPRPIFITTRVGLRGIKPCLGGNLRIIIFHLEFKGRSMDGIWTRLSSVTNSSTRETQDTNSFIHHSLHQAFYQNGTNERVIKIHLNAYPCIAATWLCCCLGIFSKHRANGLPNLP